MRIVRVLVAALMAVMAVPAAAAGFDDIADAYVKLVLEYGAHEDGYVDAYYGPKEWAEAAKAHTRSLAALREAATKLKLEAQAQAFPSDPMVQKRQRFLVAQLHALETRIAMKQGEKLSFIEEAKGLFGAAPKLQPLESFDPLLARIEALVPGEGPLADRVEAFRNRYIIPHDRLEPVMRAAIAECRARTLKHIALPDDEKFTLEFVTDKPWSGYNWYKGDATSLIEVNTDLPINISRAVDLGCHEGYPGHHTLNSRLESELVEKRGWKEFTVYPLYSPQSLIAEGSANNGIDLAFPGEERTKFEAATLYPLAGLDPATAAALSQLNEALKDLYPSRYTIADKYLSGAIDKDEAIRLIQKYQLVSAERARPTLDFIETYRSYIINYGLGQDMIADYVERAPDHWKAFEDLISEPSLPADLLARP
jgi:hypothetical protein